jgi:hypothetical protein
MSTTPEPSAGPPRPFAVSETPDGDGEHARAELIRAQCELEPMRDRYEIDRAAALHRREEELLREHEKRLLGEMPEGWRDWRAGAAAEFRRGFVDTLSMPARTFLDLGQEARRLHPTVPRVVLFRVHGYGERLAANPAKGEPPGERGLPDRGYRPGRKSAKRRQGKKKGGARS